MSIYVAPRSVVNKASPQGPAAGILQTEYPLLTILGKQTDQQKMQRAWQLGISVPWIRAAERVIGGEFTTVGWHLEDDNEETIEKGDAYDLIATPQLNTNLGKKMTRPDLWRLTCRHIGLCGNAFWYLDGLNTYGQPNAVLYIRPDRMTPVEDDRGNLIGWLIDKTPQSPGIGVRLDQIVQFMFEPPDVGHFGIGLVESALMKASLSTAIDKHLGQVLDMGGRLSGILAPKTGVLGTEQMVSLERDWRSVVEQSDAAKRLQLVAAPVDFTPTTMDLLPQIRDFMTGARDDLLGLWGVPISKLGIHDRGKGLGASNIIENDDAVLWVDAVKPRLGGQDQGGFVESVQQLLDRFAVTDGVTNLVIEEPTFDDDAPKYVEAQQALNLPLRNRERRDILGLDPLGDKIINPETGLPLDDEVWMPMTMVRAFIAPSDGQAIPMPEVAAPTADNNSTAAANAAGETSGQPTQATGLDANTGKADVTPRMRPFHDTLVKLRTNLDRRYTPKVKTAVAAFLEEQRHDIAERIRKNAAHLTHDPKDVSVWFPAKQYDQKLAAVLAPTLSTVAGTVSEHVAGIFEPTTQKADPVVDRVLNRGAARVTRINATTRDRVQSILTTGMANGLTVLEIADAIEADGFDEAVAADTGLGSLLNQAFDEYRAEMIARTEMMDAYNAAALGTYQDAGIEMVEAIDGDQDDECIERVANNPYTIDAADAEEDHPNGTLDWVPVLPGEASLGSRHEVVVMPEPPRTRPSLDLIEAKALAGMSPVVAAMLQAAIDYADRAQPTPVFAPNVTVAAPVVVNNMPEQPPAVVNVEAAKAAELPPPDIHIHVPEQPAPIVNVNIPEERPRRVIYKGDGKVDRVEPY